MHKPSQATEGPLHIARDCLGNRQRRIDYDLVQVLIIWIIVIDFKLFKKDEAQNQLLKLNIIEHYYITKYKIENH